METLAGSYLKFFPRDKDRGVCCSTEIALCGKQVAFLVPQKRLPNVSFHPKCVSPLSSAQTSVESEEIQTISSDEPRTVHVRFKLYKECAFGEQFLVVGDDAILGLWDPSEGVPLTWSEGHVWTAELDIPIGKVIRYKFILEGNVETILWQPGPDRILETFETEKVISVSDDWDNPELQAVIEEDFVDLIEESSVNSLMVAEDLNETLVEGGDNASKKVVDVDEGSDPEKDETMVVLDEEVPVLVPGLVPTSTDEIETKDSAQSELLNEDVSASLHCTEAGEVMVDEKRRFNGEEATAVMVEDMQRESDILEGDLQWGRRTLQKFLANFGFL